MRVVEEFDRVSHATIVDAFRRRDPGAVRELYREYGRLVYAVQQTFVNAWQAADRFDATRDPASWLATIARRTAIDIYRREQRRRASALAEVATDNPAIVSLPPDLGAVEAVWHVRRAIDALAPEEATIVRLQHLDGMTHSEISDKLGIALGTVKSRSHRAHRRLAMQLGHLREPVA